MENTVTTKLYAEVALSIPIDRSFHYAIPEALANAVVAGVRVEVPFGIKKSVGFVTKLSETSPVEDLKEIISVLDKEPIISSELMALAVWLKDQYICSLGEALGAIVPSSLKAPKRAQAPAAETAAPKTFPRHTLSESQRQVIAPVVDSIAAGRFHAFLLHGVTSSGKTEVYLASIEEALARGRSAIFLLPEIALTPQFISIVQKRFPGIVGVWHSQLSAGQRYRTWQAARSGAIKIILGARSCIFAPFSNLGLIIIDEEHEPTYKQEQKPSYQTKEVALERARLNNAAVVLGSATPSLDTYWRAKTAEFTLLELRERIDARVLPPVTLVETQHMTKNSRILSAALISAITRVLARREQAILFLNRRGFAPGIMCHSCGRVWQCPHCAISLVYHLANDGRPEGLQCHYCGYKEDWPGKCPHCGEKQLAIFGVGTQKVEQELKRIFPQGRILRLDRDTTSKKGVYEKAYEDFKNENVDILLGTQMVAKGFDFPRVTLVGVIDADTALYLPDFRSAERTFQLITQVAGRSGRSSLGGEVIVQTHHATHYALVAAQKHDYIGIYEKELSYRKDMGYPPFTRLVNIILRGRKEEKVSEAATLVSDELKKWMAANNVAFELLGPSPAAHAKIRNLFRWQLLLKGEIKTLLEAVRYIKKYPLRGGILMNIDVDPQDTI